jgi:hypothetical protein
MMNQVAVLILMMLRYGAYCINNLFLCFILEYFGLMGGAHARLKLIKWELKVRKILTFYLLSVVVVLVSFEEACFG